MEVEDTCVRDLPYNDGDKSRTNNVINNTSAAGDSREVLIHASVEKVNDPKVSDANNLHLQNLSTDANDAGVVLNENNRSYTTDLDCDRLTETSLSDTSAQSATDISSDELLYQTAEEDNTTSGHAIHDAAESSSSYGNREADDSPRNTQASRMSVDSLPSQDSADTLPVIIYEREERMSIDSVSEGVGGIKRSNRMSVECSSADVSEHHRRMERMSVDSSSRHKRLNEIVRDVENCFKDNRGEEAKTLVREQYVILEILRTDEEERNGVDMAAMYILCASFSLDCGLKKQAILSYYKGLLEMNDGEVEYLYHLNLVSEYWINILTPDVHLQEKINICKELRTMADDRLQKSDGKQYNVPRAIYSHLCFYTFENLRKMYPKNRQIPEERLKAIVRVSKCYMRTGHYHGVATKICKPFVEHEYPDSAELYELWAKCLQALGKTDIAIKKAESALEVAQDQSHKVSLKKLLAELKLDFEMKSKMSKDEPVDSDNEWLEGTNIHEPMKNVKTIEDIKTSHVKKTKRRPKSRHSMEFFSDFKKTWNEIRSQHDQRNKANPPLRPMNEDDQFSFRKKRRRRNTAGSDASTIGCLHDDLLDDEVSLPVCDTNDSDSDSEFFEFQNSFGAIVESEQSEDSDNDNECQAFYEKSIKENDDEENEQTQEIDMLTNGIPLSPGFVKRKQIVDKKYHYSDSLPNECLKQLLLTNPKTYKKCQLHIEGAHTATCTVVSTGDDIKEIEICGRTKAGKNFTDDVVVVEILKHPSILDSGLDVIPRLNKVLSNQTDDQKAYGKVVGRLERRKFSNIDHPVFVCEMDEFEYNLMRPLCQTIPKIRILQEHTESKFQIERYDFDSDNGELNFAELKNINPAQKRSFVFLVVYIRWDTVYPTGAVLKIIKSEGSVKKAMKIQEFLHQVPTKYLPKTLECVQNLIAGCNKSALQSNESDRLDLSALSVFTIDPPESKDLDDALSVQGMENDRFCVGVHISDVTAFVKKDDDIDKEAQKRATTFYPGQGYKPFHMLPEPLSQDMCSLIPNENRLALSVFLYMDKNGMMLKEQPPVIRKTIIRSRRKFTYNEVQGIITDKSDNDEFSDDLKILFHLAKKQRMRRLGNAIHALPVETDPSLYSDSVLKSTEAHYLVEEFMVLANGIAANFVCRTFHSCVPLRCQDAPSSDVVSHWLKNYPTIADIILKIQGIKPLPNKQLAVKDAPNKRYTELIMLQKWTWEALETAVKENDFGEAWKLVGSDELHPKQSIALTEWLRFQETAEYRCFGTTCSKKHFSLNVYPYTHFTSPIRRYPDIIVHRLIHAALNSDNSPYTTNEVDELCHHINEITKRAKAYGKQCSFIQMGEKFRKNPLMLHAFVEEVSDKNIIFHIPGMHRFPQSCKELPLQLLDVSRKPEIAKDVDTNRDILTLQWQKRLYSHRGYSPRSRGYETKRLDPHMRTVFEQYNKWLEILKALFSNDQGLMRKIMDANGKYRDYSTQEMIRDWVPACTKTVKDVSSENRQGPITKHLTSFSMSFSHAQVIGVQLCAESRKGILVPFPQVLDLTKNVKICLQHAMDPVKHLAKYGTTKSKGQKGRYSSCAEYMETWLPILQMESATAATKEDSIAINDVPVRLDSRGGKFTLTLPFCDERNINFPSMSMNLILKGEDEQEQEENSHEIHYLSSSNFICVKYEMDLTTDEQSKGCPTGKRIWVGHGQIDKIKDKEKGKRDIYFTLNSGSLRPPVEATEGKKVNMSIEIMEKPKSNSRTESIVQCLEKSTTLAKAVAFGNRIPKLDSGHLELAKKSDCDIRAEDLVPNNSKQHEAIKKALTSSFSLIQGPPGTGKTYTGIKLVTLFTKLNLKWKEKGNDMKQVVFCGPSNKSVDLVAKWVIKKLGGNAPDIIRMYGSALENVDYPVPGIVMSSRTRADNRPDDKLREVSLHHLIRKRDRPYAEEIKQFDTEFRQVPGNMDREQSNEYRKKVRSYKKILSKASLEELKRHEVIFCTTAMATNPKFIRSIKDRVYQCIIDECGMCTEPECIATLIATKAKQVVLIGDHKQLRPVVLCSAAADLGLEKSLFERYSDSATFLNKQYRMNPRICDFVSEQFYDRKLETGPSVAWKVNVPLSIWQFEHIPHIFCNVEGTEIFQTVATEEGSERSCSNNEEVEKVYHVFSRLIHAERVPYNQINIISQYNAQCHAIREYLQSKGFTTKEHGFSVNTVVASQGGEWDYVIFSTVRSLPDYKIEDKPTLGWCTQNLGFITDHNQINVALSRARKGLIIIGNKELLGCDTVWRNLLDHYQKRGCVLDAKDFPPRVHRKTQRSRSQASRISRQTSADFYKGTDMEIDV